MPGQVPEAAREERRADIMRLQAEISAEKLAALSGSRMRVLVDAAHPDWPGLHTGRVWRQAPEIDGLTYVSGPGVRPGAMVEAEIVDTREYDLSALA
jgi:tRNA-2-methylthio-N6-dimethylallyladenosine synthase/ribosomal protein S12 methylthiotransferase